MTKKKKGWAGSTRVPQASIQCSSADLMKEPSVTTTLRLELKAKNLILLSRRSTGQISMLCSKTAGPWTNHSPRPHPCGCQVLFFFSEEIEIDNEDKWWLQLEKKGPLTQSFLKRIRSPFTSREELHEEGEPLSSP